MTESNFTAEDAHGEHAAVQPRIKLPVALQGLFLLILGGVLVALFFVVPAIVGLAAPADSDEQAAPAGAFHPTDLQWAGLRVQKVAQLDYTPTVHAEGRIAVDDDLNTPVFSPYSGKVTRVLARAGDVVAAGAPLFAVQSNEIAQAENDLVSGVATLHTAQAQLELAVANESRQHKLYLAHGAAEKDWAQSRVDLATARGGLATAQIGVASVRNRLAILGLDKAGVARIETAADPLHAAAEIIARAPVSGTITQRALAPGQNIVGSVTSQGNAGAVFTIGNLGTLWMVASAAEADAGRFQVGDEAVVHVPAYPGRAFQGRVSYVAPMIDANTHRLLVRADVPNPDGALKPDMLAQFDIQTGPPAPVLAVPDRAVVYEGSDAHVWVADPVHKTLALRPIVTGWTDGGMVQVLRGLAASDSVVTSGAVFIDRTLSDN